MASGAALPVWDITEQVRRQQMRGSPTLFDATTKEVYDESRIPEGFRLTALICRMMYMRTTLDQFYREFLLQYPLFWGGLNENTKTTMPMLTVMQDGRYLIWSSSARVSYSPFPPLARREQRQLPGMISVFGGKERFTHVFRWGCGESGCLERIIQDRIEEQRLAWRPHTICKELIPYLRNLNLRALSIASSGRFSQIRYSNATVWEWHDDRVPFFQSAYRKQGLIHSCSGIFNEIMVTDSAGVGSIERMDQRPSGRQE